MKAKRLLAFFIAVLMCASAVCTTGIFASNGEDRIVTQENFDDGVINTSGTSAAVSAAGGFLFDVSGGTGYSLENGTLRYFDRRGEIIDVRFYHDTDAQRDL